MTAAVIAELANITGVGDLVDERFGFDYLFDKGKIDNGEIGIEMFQTISDAYKAAVVNGDCANTFGTTIVKTMKEKHPLAELAFLTTKEKFNNTTARKVKRCREALTALAFMEVGDGDGCLDPVSGKQIEYAWGKGSNGTTTQYNLIVNDLVWSGCVTGSIDEHAVSEDAPADGNYKALFEEFQPKRQLLRRALVNAITQVGVAVMPGAAAYLNEYKVRVQDPGMDEEMSD